MLSSLSTIKFIDFIYLLISRIVIYKHIQRLKLIILFVIFFFFFELIHAFHSLTRINLTTTFSGHNINNALSAEWHLQCKTLLLLRECKHLSCSIRLLPYVGHSTLKKISAQCRHLQLTGYSDTNFCHPVSINWPCSSSLLFTYFACPFCLNFLS
jgi:hypothetical protein